VGTDSEQQKLRSRNDSHLYLYLYRVLFAQPLSSRFMTRKRSVDYRRMARWLNRVSYQSGGRPPNVMDKGILHRAKIMLIEYYD